MSPKCLDNIHKLYNITCFESSVVFLEQVLGEDHCCNSVAQCYSPYGTQSNEVFSHLTPLVAVLMIIYKANDLCDNENDLAMIFVCKLA